MLHGMYRTLQGRQRETIVKTLRFILSPEFVKGGGGARRNLTLRVTSCFILILLTTIVMQWHSI